MSAAWALLILGVGQGIIYIVMRMFVQRASAGEPTRLLRFIVAVVGVVAAALLAGAGYLALMGGGV